ncbi:MAG: hypothetical protein ACYCXT_07750 [Acidiferrobacteraceae bacterium]
MYADIASRAAGGACWTVCPGGKITICPPPDRGVTAPTRTQKSHREHLDYFLVIDTPGFWSKLDGLTSYQAAALSVGIDPDGLEMLIDLQRQDQAGEAHVEIHFGEKQVPFRENRRLIDTAIQVGTLPLINGLIPHKEFYPWLATKGLFDPRHAENQTSNVIDVFLKSFLGEDYQDYTRLKLAIRGAKRYATGEAKKQPDVVEFLAEVMGIQPGEFLEARQNIAYVSQPKKRSRLGRR